MGWHRTTQTVYFGTQKNIMDNSDEEKTEKKWFQYQTNDPNGWILFQ